MSSPTDAALAELPWLRRLARSLAGDEAEDLVQEVYLLAHRAPSGTAPEAGWRGWLATVMRHRWCSLRRAASSRARRETWWSEPDTSAPGPEQLVSAAESIEALERALRALSEADRTLILERFFAGRRAVEIAEARGVPAATVRNRTRRALERLRRELRRASSGVVVVGPWASVVRGGWMMANTKMVVGGVAVALLVAGWLWRDRTQAVSVAQVADLRSRSEFETIPAPSAASEPFSPQPSLAVPPTKADPSNGNDLAKFMDPSAKPSGDVAPEECARAFHRNPDACEFLDPPDAVLQEMARCRVVRYDFPEMFARRDWTPEFERGWLDLVGAAPDERDRISSIAAGVRTELFGELEAIGAELGHEPWPDDVTLLDVVVDLSVAVGDDEVRRISRRIARERVGLAEPPEPGSTLSPAERFVRTFVAVGDRLEQRLAAELGETRAHELHAARDGWPGVRMNTGASCPQ